MVELGASSSFWDQAHWSCQQRLFYSFLWKVGPLSQSLYGTILPPPGSIP